MADFVLVLKDRWFSYLNNYLWLIQSRGTYAWLSRAGTLHETLKKNFSTANSHFRAMSLNGLIKSIWQSEKLKSGKKKWAKRDNTRQPDSLTNVSHEQENKGKSLDYFWNNIK